MLILHRLADHLKIVGRLPKVVANKLPTYLLAAAAYVQLQRLLLTGALAIVPF